MTKKWIIRNEKLMSPAAAKHIVCKYLGNGEYAVLQGLIVLDEDEQVWVDVFVDDIKHE